MLSVLFAFLFAGMSVVAQAEALRVTLLLSDSGGAYQAYGNALAGKLEGSFHVTTYLPDQPLGESDLYIAVGMKAAKILAERDVPSLTVLVPKEGFDSLPRGPARRTSPRSAIYLDQPLERQVALLVDALPETRSVGVLYSEQPSGLPVLRRILAGKKIRLVERSIDEEQSLSDALEDLLSKSEVLFVLPDPKIYNASTIRNILLTSYRKQVPLIGFSEAYVKAGALCAIYSSVDQIVAQSADAVRRFAESGKLPPAQYPREFEVSINIQVARSLDIPIKDATRLREDIRRNP